MKEELANIIINSSLYCLWAFYYVRKKDYALIPILCYFGQ